MTESDRFERLTVPIVRSMTTEPRYDQTVAAPNREQRHNPKRLAYSPAEAAALLGCARSSIYQSLRRGDVRSVLLGGRRLIPAAELTRLLGLEEDGAE